ncbi:MULTISPECIES: hypothetical protein [Vibrio]|uniref:hypothetical protein n=1 Tax=Vibrio TaxID=662 RepID=UPI0018F0F495|nr:hypothetical protein [Vibrio cholerae]MBJ6977164.1 hypothetical protein [Vibrio cholerae]
MDWLIENKEWVFSGVGVLVMSIIFSYFLKTYKTNGIKQSITSGNSALNVQGKNVTVNIGKKDEE